MSEGPAVLAQTPVNEQGSPRRAMSLLKVRSLSCRGAGIVLAGIALGACSPLRGMSPLSTPTVSESAAERDAVRRAGQTQAPVKISATAPAITLTAGAPDRRVMDDRPDDYAGLYQLHVVYALFKGEKDRARDTDGSIANSIKLANQWFMDQTGGAILRFDTYDGALDITFVQFEQTIEDALDQYRRRAESSDQVPEDFLVSYVDSAFVHTGIYAKGKYYIVYVESDHQNLCGSSRFAAAPGVFFLGTEGCGYGRLGVDAYAWNTEFVLLHEVLHGIGFVPTCAPHNVPGNPHHVNDSDIDLMYPYVKMGQQQVLDVGHDDDYKHNMEDCPDLADSVFLEPLPPDAQVPMGWPSQYRLPE